MKTKRDPARTECDDGLDMKICRTWVVCRSWIKPKPIWEDDDLDEEGCVEEEEEDGHPHLQMPRLLSSSVAPQQYAQQLVHIALDNISQGEVSQIVTGN